MNNQTQTLKNKMTTENQNMTKKERQLPSKPLTAEAKRLALTYSNMSAEDRWAAETLLSVQSKTGSEWNIPAGSVFYKLQALHTRGNLAESLTGQNELLKKQNKELLERLNEKEKELTQLTLQLYTNGLRYSPGIGCNKCYSCVTGGSKPCLNVPRRPRKTTRCQAKTCTGKKCSRKPEDGQTYCYQHST